MLSLRAAILGRDLTEVKLIVNNGLGDDAQRKRNHALYLAACVQSLEIAEFLVYSGADVNNRDLKDECILYVAIDAEQPDLELVRFLVDNGADVNLQGGLWGSALQAAAARQNLEIVEFLVDNGADVNLKGELQQTALHHAVGGSTEIVEILLNKNACPDARNDAGITPFDMAIEAKQRDIILLLLSRMKPPPSLSTKRWRTALCSKPTSCYRYTFGEYLTVKEIQTPDVILGSAEIQDIFSGGGGYYGSAWPPESPEKRTHVVLNSDVGDIIPSSTFGCQWQRVQFEGKFSLWSLESSPPPSLDLCMQLDRTKFYIECWYTISCLTITWNNWPPPQPSIPENFYFLERVEGFYWVTTRWPSENSDGDRPIEDLLLRPIFSATTCEDCPVRTIGGIGDLLVPLIEKCDRIFADNFFWANDQLSKSRRDVLRSGGSSPDLIHGLLSDATVIERISENHAYIVQSLIELIHDVGHLQKGPWKLSEKSLKKSRKMLRNFARHRKAWRVLSEKSQGIIELEFNLTSIMEARKSTSTNRSLKRLTWVTFVFLPLLFVASLFGKNVDILSHNPSWWWYFPIAGAFMLLTFSVWIFFKRFHALEGSLEKYFAWLVGDDDSAAVRQSAKREEESKHGKKQSDVRNSTNMLGKLRLRRRRKTAVESIRSADEESVYYAID